MGVISLSSLKAWCLSVAGTAGVAGVKGGVLGVKN